jgi:transposase-like protein
MQTGHRKDDKALKVETVRLVQTSEKSISRIAQELGRADSNLCRWCQEYGAHGTQAFVGSGHQQSRARSVLGDGRSPTEPKRRKVVAMSYEEPKP